MKSKKSCFLTALVGGTILLGIAIIIVSLFANRQHWDRDTAFAAAKYDAAAILSVIDQAPATAVDYPEVEEGPLMPDLRNVQEAWVAWRQTFDTDGKFEAIVAWHREQLSADWILESGPDKATFQRGEWTLSLEAEPGGSKTRYRRVLQWTRDPEVL